MESKSKGNVTELQAITYFVSKDYRVSIPFGENCRYDFIVDIDGRLLRIQAKSSRQKKPNCFEFSCLRTQNNSKGARRFQYSKDEIDYFCTVWNNVCYLVPVEECSNEKRLWLGPTRNKQTKGVHYAKDYTLEVQLSKILEENSKTNQ